MPLPAGSRLGPYEVVSPIGAGGMGEVYRARDTRLDRSVAIKILPPSLAADAQLRERFEREARAISSLHHPHICALYDVGAASIAPSRGGDGSVAGLDGDAIRFLVLELLEGETLETRLRRSGPLPVPEAIRIALQVCDALHTAHASGIVHRDLKPGNVFLERVGGSAPVSAKLLDFGLAKTASPVHPALAPSLPTTPATLTEQGTILGTFQYMAPEQIEGLEADARSDIFAFGAVLFEMLTGRLAFEGRTRAALLGAILKEAAPDASTITPAVPEPVGRVLATCLAKDPNDRWQSARDVAHALQLASAAHVSMVTAPQGRRNMTLWTVGAAMMLALAAGAAGLVLGRLQRTGLDASPVAFPIRPPAGHTFGTPAGGGTGIAPQAAVSPDGRHIVFVVEGAQGQHALWLRELGTDDVQRIPGTDGSAFPFWSPDSRQIGFFAHGKLKKVNIAGGWPQDVCDAADGRGGTWNSENVIVFTPATAGGLQQVSAAGGAPVTISQLDKAYGETSHRFPWFLPDGRHYLYTASIGGCCPAGIPSRVKIGALDSSTSTTLMQVESSAAYATGHLLFNRGGTLLAQPFDPSTRSLQGDPFVVADAVSSESSRYASFSVSQTGTLLLAREGSPLAGQLTWHDRSGRPLQTIGEPAAYTTVALSPDDRTIAAAIRAPTAETPGNIYLIDATTGGSKRVTFERVQDYSPVWSPNAQRLAFVGRREGAVALNLLTIASSHEEVLLRAPAAQAAGNYLRPSDWSKDGKYILGTKIGSPGGSTDLWTLSLDTREQRSYAETPAQEFNGVFSPDGKWVAYELTDVGSEATQIFVGRFPFTGEKHQISTAGGVQPIWAGKEIFFLVPTGGGMELMSAEVTPGAVFKQPRRPRRLFPIQATATAILGRQYAVSRDGQRFLVAVRQPAPSVPLSVVVNWLSATK